MQKSHKTYFHSDPSIRQTGRRRGMYATPPMDTGGLQAALTHLASFFFPSQRLSRFNVIRDFVSFLPPAVEKCTSGCFRLATLALIFIPGHTRNTQKNRKNKDLVKSYRPCSVLTAEFSLQQLSSWKWSGLLGVLRLSLRTTLINLF